MTERTYTLVAGPDREVLGPYPTEAEARYEKKPAKVSDETVVPH